MCCDIIYTVNDDVIVCFPGNCVDVCVRLETVMFRCDMLVMGINMRGIIGELFNATISGCEILAKMADRRGDPNFIKRPRYIARFVYI